MTKQRIVAGRGFIGAAVGVAVFGAVVPQAWVTATAALSIAILIVGFVPADGRRHVVAAMLGLATSSGAIMLFATGVFMGPLIAEYGWTQAEYFAAVQIALPITIVTPALVGLTVDRWGVCWTVLPSMAGLSAALVALGIFTSNLASFYLLFCLIPLLGAGTSSVAFARLVTGWFDSNRGLALGAALAGMGAGGAILPPFLGAVVGAFGWRMGFVGLAILVLIALPIVAMLLIEPPARAASESQLRCKRASLLSIARSSAFRWMAAAFYLLALAIGGLMYPLVPILGAFGIAPESVALIAGLMSLALIAGRAFAGMLMDRFFAPHVAIAFLLGPLVGSLLLATGSGPAAAIVAVVLIGLAAGAEVDVLAYLVSRYFPTVQYGAVYGTLYAIWTTGASCGPLIAAFAHDRSGAYQPALVAFATLFAAAGFCLSRLRPYANSESRIGDGEGGLQKAG